MLVKKQDEKDANANHYSNSICQDTFQSLPKIYGTIKSKVMANKISFYQNIKRKQRLNLIKSVNKQDFAQELSSGSSVKAKETSKRNSKMEQKPTSKEEKVQFKNFAKFSDKFHKFETKSSQKHERYITSGQADDRQSKHKIKFNTIRFLPILPNQQGLHEDNLDNTSQLPSEKVSKSVLISNPLVHLYRQDKTKIKKIKTSLTEDTMISPNSMMNGSLTNTNKRQEQLRGRIKTEVGTQSVVKKTSKGQTEFSRRISDEKISGLLNNPLEGKYHIPTQQQYKEFIQNYKPINPGFSLRKSVTRDDFQIINYSDGVYFGISQAGTRKGQGVLVTQNSLYEGLFEGDEKLKGSEQNMDGKYIGSFKKDLREGKGRYEWNNGEFYQGDWKEGKKNGYGIWQSPNGDSYVGYWLNGRQHGIGTHTHKSSVYKGEFVNSLKHGLGEQTFSNGDRFKGYYNQGKPSGKGRYEWVDGSSYEGEFVNGYRDGTGILMQSDGSSYKGKGSFRRDFKHGLGQSISKTGEKYEVQYNEGSTIYQKPLKT